MAKNQKSAFKYQLYLAGGIGIWKDFFKPKYSEFFNKKVYLFEPGSLGGPSDHRFMPIGIACYDLNEINHADALLVYMKKYRPADGSPTGTDSTWECGYAISQSKPIIMLIEDLDHLDYYNLQWMVSFSINAVLTTDEKVAETCRNHPKFVHTTVLYAPSKNQLESKIIEYLTNYYRSIYSRSGIINYQVDERARDLFGEKRLAEMTFTETTADKTIYKLLTGLKQCRFNNDSDYLKVCEIERKVSAHLRNRLTEKNINSALAAVIKHWAPKKENIVSILKHSIVPPFLKIKNRHAGIIKTRPELFFELYDLVNHHLIREQKFIKDPDFPYEMGAIIELYNWMNTYSLDDTFDSSDYRQNIPTVWKQFGRRNAIFTGLTGHLLALKYLFLIARPKPQLAERLAGILNDYNELMYQGQVLDLKLTFSSSQKKKLLNKLGLRAICKLYIKRIYGICGGFYEAVGELAAQAGNKEAQVLNGKQIDKISPLIGLYYGLIQMIRNDLADYLVIEKISGMSHSMKGISHSDIKEGKIDLPYSIAFYSSKLDKKEKRFLFTALADKELSAKDKLHINELLWKSGAIDLTVDLIINLASHVKTTLLTEYQETPTRMKWMFSLVDITKEILIPFKSLALSHGWVKYQYDRKLLRTISDLILQLESTPRPKRIK